jgi:translation elongation factor EF-Ts
MGIPNHPFIAAYAHYGWIGVLVEFGTETKFATRTPEFRRLSTDIAMQVAVTSPVDVSDLLVQAFVKDRALTVADVLQRATRELGETIVVRRFVRWAHEKPGDDDREPPKDPGQVIPFGRR